MTLPGKQYDTILATTLHSNALFGVSLLLGLIKTIHVHNKIQKLGN